MLHSYNSAHIPLPSAAGNDIFLLAFLLSFLSSLGILQPILFPREGHSPPVFLPLSPSVALWFFFLYSFSSLFCHYQRCWKAFCCSSFLIWVCQVLVKIHSLVWCTKVSGKMPALPSHRNGGNIFGWTHCAAMNVSWFPRARIFPRWLCGDQTCRISFYC